MFYTAHSCSVPLFHVLYPYTLHLLPVLVFWSPSQAHVSTLTSKISAHIIFAKPRACWCFCGPHLLYFYLLEVQVSPTIIYSYTHNYYSQIPSQTFPGILLFLLYHNSCILNLTPKIPSRQNSEILLIECAKWTQSKGLVAKAKPWRVGALSGLFL